MDLSKPFVFISYHMNSTGKFVKELSEELDNFGIDHWYATRDIAPGQTYAQEIPKVIEKCSFVLILLNKWSNDSDQVKNEYLKAYELKKPIYIAKLDECDESEHFSFLRSSTQFLLLNGMNDTVCIQKLCYNINDFFCNNIGVPEFDVSVLDSVRSDTQMEFYSYEEERRRIAVQRDFVYDFAKDIYKEVLDQFDSPSILDVGCNTGEQFMMYLKDHPTFSHYVGIDREASALEHGTSLFGDSNCHFHQLDIDSSDFDKKLYEIEKQYGLNGFDIINISMVILHVKKPRRLLDTLKNHLAEGGKFVILDIDDGYNIAYPDNQGYFQRAVNICEYTSFSGYRKSGRELPSYLKEIDLSHIKLHRIGLSTIGMNRKKRSDLFDIYFWFIYDDLKIMNKQHPDSKVIKADLNWFDSVYDDMKYQFKKSDFYFTLGFVLFTAEGEIGD